MIGVLTVKSNKLIIMRFGISVISDVQGLSHMGYYKWYWFARLINKRESY
jgi:hypothetical protein